MSERFFRVALAGNPNCGKTTLLNLLTGAHQHVGNYPGVTVEKKTGAFYCHGAKIELIDLPGVYSLSSSSPEERVAQRELLENPPDLIMNVLDSSMAERGLYLSIQLAGLELPMLVVLNIFDEAEKNGLKFDLDNFAKLLRCRVVTAAAAHGQGAAEVRRAMMDILEGRTESRPGHVGWHGDLEKSMEEVRKMLDAPGAPVPDYPHAFLAEKLLEWGPVIRNEVAAIPGGSRLLADIEPIRAAYKQHTGVDIETALPENRYAHVSGICRETIHRLPKANRQQISDMIDRVATHPVLGIPVFLFLMFIIFKLTFAVGDPLAEVLESCFGLLGKGVSAVWPAGHAVWLHDLITDGIIAGVGGVLVFLPNILMLFLAIAVLEGTGYMARAAFIMDQLMHRFGLHGKSFIPMLIGFGCTVPAIMATRTIESKRDRLTTIMVLPLMSCGARLPIYSLLIPVFFPVRYQAPVLWLIYLIGILLAVGGARILKSTLFKGEDEIFIMELPPYRLPTLRTILIHMWERAVLYLKKAGTVILFASILLWLAGNYPRPETLSRDYEGEIASVAAMTVLPESTRSARIEQLRAARYMEISRTTIMGRAGRALAVVMKPAGFDWRTSSSLIGAAAGKELFVSQLGIIFASDGNVTLDQLRASLRKAYTPLQGFCIMLFCLVTLPCAATFAIVGKETGSWGLAILQAAGLTVLAWVLTAAVYQLGSLIL